MTQIIINITAFIAFALLVGNLMTTVFQQYFIFRPSSLGTDHKFEFTHPFEELFLESDYGIINALLFRSAGTNRKIVLYCHGNSGDLQRWGNEADFFLQQGYDFICYDYAGFGKSKGKRTELAMNQQAISVLDHLLENGYDNNDIMIYGRSIGCAFASFLASEYQCKSLILETPFFSLPSLFYTYYPIFPRLFFFKFKLPVYQYVQSSKCSVSIIQGTNDLIIPYKDAMKLTPYVGKESFFVIEGGKHNDLSLFPEFHAIRKRLFRSMESKK